GRVDAGADLPQAEVPSGLDDRAAHVLALLPGAPELEAGDARHPVVQGPHPATRDREPAHVEEPDLGQRAAVRLPQHVERGRALDLEPVELATAGRVDD